MMNVFEMHAEQNIYTRWTCIYTQWTFFFNTVNFFLTCTFSWKWTQLQFWTFIGIWNSELSLNVNKFKKHEQFFKTWTKFGISNIFWKFGIYEKQKGTKKRNIIRLKTNEKEEVISRKYMKKTGENVKENKTVKKLRELLKGSQNRLLAQSGSARITSVACFASPKPWWFDAHRWQIGFAVRGVESYRRRHAQEAVHLGQPIVDLSHTETAKNLSKKKWQCEGSNHVTHDVDRSSLGTWADKLQCLTTKTQTTRTIPQRSVYCSERSFSHIFFFYFYKKIVSFSFFVSLFFLKNARPYKNFSKISKMFSFLNFIHKIQIFAF